MTTTDRPVVLGLDLSLAGTGCATRMRAWTHKTRGQRGDSYAERLARLVAVRRWVIDQIGAVGPDLIVVEGPAPNATARVSSWDRAKLWWDVLEAANTHGVPLAVAPPPNVKKFATGTGNCKKLAMVAAAYKRLPHLEVADDNQADAAWLMAMGHQWLADPVTATAMPLDHARALNGVLWPDRVRVAA